LIIDKDSNLGDKSNELKNSYNYRLELTQHPLVLEKHYNNSSSLYLMEIVNLMIIYESGKTKNLNIIILPKLKNIFNLTSEKTEKIISILLNANDKNYLRQIFDKNLFINTRENSINGLDNLPNFKTVLFALKDNTQAKLVLLRDLFFCLFNNELKELTSEKFYEICLYILETEKNKFLKNETLKNFIYSIINNCNYYTITTKDDFQFYRTINENSEIKYKRKALDVLFKMMSTTPDLKKNIINSLIDLLSHFYNKSFIDENLLQRDDIKSFIELLQKESFPNKKYLEKFDPIDFYQNISYLDEVIISIL